MPCLSSLAAKDPGELVDLFGREPARTIGLEAQEEFGRLLQLLRGVDRAVERLRRHDRAVIGQKHGRMAPAEAADGIARPAIARLRYGHHPTRPTRITT